MSSPGIIVQNLVRKYVKENQISCSFENTINDILYKMENTNVKNIAMDQIIQTNTLYNFKDVDYNYDFLNQLELNNEDSNDEDLNNEDIFELDEEQKDIDEISKKKYISENVFQYGALYNIFGAELIDEKWILYCFIISKIYKSFRKNVLDDNVKINSLHIGQDNGSVQCSLNHLFNYSTIFENQKVIWNWVSMDNNNKLNNINKYINNFIQPLEIYPLWKQLSFIINKLSDHSINKFNLLIFQPFLDLKNDIEIRQCYLVCIILLIKFLDSQGIALIELRKFTILEFNILGLCSLIFSNVYMTKYDIGNIYTVIICKEKKKNLNTNSILKKLIKILNESDTKCIVRKSIFSDEWINTVSNLNNLNCVGFDSIIDHIKNILMQNLNPIF